MRHIFAFLESRHDSYFKSVDIVFFNFFFFIYIYTANHRAVFFSSIFNYVVSYCII